MNLKDLNLAVDTIDREIAALRERKRELNETRRQLLLLEEAKVKLAAFSPEELAALESAGLHVQPGAAVAQLRG
jgi:hypothetical protein